MGKYSRQIGLMWWCFSGIVASIVLLTLCMPITVVLLGESDIFKIGVHAQSLTAIRNAISLSTLLAILINTINLFVFLRIKSKKSLALLAAFNILYLLIISSSYIYFFGSKERIHQVFEHVWENISNSATKNLIQSFYLCCGFNSYMEYGSKLEDLPRSCFPKLQSHRPWNTGCYEQICGYALLNNFTNNSGVTEILQLPGVSFNPIWICIIVLCNALFFHQIIVVIGLFLSFKQIESKEKMQNYLYDANKSSRIDELPNSESNSLFLEKECEEEPKKSKIITISELTSKVTAFLDNGFYKVGVLVARNARKTVSMSVIIFVCFCFGWVQFSIRESPQGDFLPSHSAIIEEQRLYQESFNLKYNSHVIIIESDDIANKNIFKIMVDIDKKIKAITIQNNLTFDSGLCHIVHGKCLQRSLLELWDYNYEKIQTITSTEIQNITKAESAHSPYFGDVIKMKEMFSRKLEKNHNSSKTSQATRMFYATKSDLPSEWEDAFINIAQQNYGGSVKVFVSSEKSLLSEMNRLPDKEFILLSAGAFIVVCYVIYSIGNASLIKHRFYVGCLGVLGTVFGILSGFGMAFALGYPWSMLHFAAPFLALGIGMDDMFIITQTWDNILNDSKFQKRSVSEQSGLVLQKCGVAILVTTLTDLVVFFVGSSSLLGAMASFNFYVGCALAFVFLIYLTFFSAVMVLDQERRNKNYDACLLCLYKHKKDIDNVDNQQTKCIQRLFENYVSVYILKFPVKLFVLTTSTALLVVMIFGCTKLHIDLDIKWYLPSNGYLKSFLETDEFYFASPTIKTEVVFIGNVYEERHKLHELYARLQRNQFVQNGSVVSWLEDYSDFMRSTFNVEDIYSKNTFNNSDQFTSTVALFFFSDQGSTYKKDVVIEENVITASQFQLHHIYASHLDEEVKAMDSIREDCDAINTIGNVFPYSPNYIFIGAVKIINYELVRNIPLIIAVIFTIVLLLVASLQLTLWILFVVVLTTVDVAGILYFAGLSIELVTTMALMLSVGLVVDYASHMGHQFMIVNGSKQDRVQLTMKKIGPAVFNAGFSSLAVVLFLHGSDIYGFKVYFVTFISVTILGIWHGLFLLPVLLSYFGPKAYNNSNIKNS